MKQILPIQSIGVLAESELSSSARLVAVMLMYHVNRKTGFCFPSVATLAADCGCQPATVKKALSELREYGFITWETKQIPKSSTRANHYNLSFSHWSNIDQQNGLQVDNHENIETQKKDKKKRKIAQFEGTKASKDNGAFEASCKPIETHYEWRQFKANSMRKWGGE